MPKVQQYNPSGNVSTQAVDYRRMEQVDSGVGQLGQSIQQVGNQMLVDGVKQREEAEINRANDAYLSWEERRVQKLHGENGYFTTAGQDAYNQVNTTLEELEKEKKSVIEGLNEREQALFDKQYQRAMLNTKQSVMKHGNDGLKTWSLQTEEANLENGFENGALNYRNDDQVALYMGVSLEAVRNKAQLEGVTGKELTERLETARSKYLATVIGRAIKQDPQRGEELLEKHAKSMEVADLDQARADLEGYKRDQEVVQATDNWMAQGLSISGAREQAQSIDDPETRKEAMTAFKVRYKEREYEINKSKNDMFNRYSSAIDNGEASYLSIPRQDRDFLTHGQRNSLKALEQQKAQGIKVQEMPFDLRMKLDDLISNGKNEEASRVLTENAHKMTKQDRKEYSKAVHKTIEDPGVKSFLTGKEKLKIIASNLGLSDEEKNKLLMQMDDWHRKFQMLNEGKEPMGQDIDDAIDDLVMKAGEKVGDGYWEHYEFEAEEHGRENPVDRMINEGVRQGFIKRYGREPSEEDLKLMYQILKEKGVK